MRWKTAEISGWGSALSAQQEVARPERQTAFKGLLPGPAIGNLRSYGDVPLNSGGRGIDMTRLDRFLSFDEKKGILDVEAGAKIIDILRTFGPKGWMPAVMPGTGLATVGGCIANDIHGKNHHIDGTFGQHVESVLLLGANGKTRRVTEKRHPELFRATVGGVGQTGIILSARLRMARCPGGKMQVRERRVEDIHSFVDLLGSSEAAYTVGWVDATATGADVGRGILEEGEFAADSLFDPPKKRLTVPINAPSFALSPMVVKLFNTYYLSRVSVAGRSRQRPLEEFFFPLDRIQRWNRLYGRQGFYQFQCVVPLEGASEVLSEMLLRVARAGLVSPLAVLKRLGAGRAGMMSFPMEGMTLAFDLPNRATTHEVLQRLEALTLEAGGRVYFAKDGAASPYSIPAMYPELEDYRAVIREADPDGVFATDLVRRLELRGA